MAAGVAGEDMAGMVAMEGMADTADGEAAGVDIDDTMAAAGDEDGTGNEKIISNQWNDCLQ